MLELKKLPSESKMKKTDQSALVTNEKWPFQIPCYPFMGEPGPSREGCGGMTNPPKLPDHLVPCFFHTSSTFASFWCTGVLPRPRSPWGMINPPMLPDHLVPCTFHTTSPGASWGCTGCLLSNKNMSLATTNWHFLHGIVPSIFSLFVWDYNYEVLCFLNIVGAFFHLNLGYGTHIFLFLYVGLPFFCICYISFIDQQSTIFLYFCNFQDLSSCNLNISLALIDIFWWHSLQL